MIITTDRLRKIVESYQATIEHERIYTVEQLVDRVGAPIPVPFKDNEVLLAYKRTHNEISSFTIEYHMYEKGTPLSINIQPYFNGTIITMCLEKMLEGYHPCPGEPKDRFGNLRQERTIPQAKIPQASDILIGYAGKKE
jgi:hypothetical protein